MHAYGATQSREAADVGRMADIRSLFAAGLTRASVIHQTALHPPARLELQHSQADEYGKKRTGEIKIIRNVF